MLDLRTGGWVLLIGALLLLVRQVSRAGLQGAWRDPLSFSCLSSAFYGAGLIAPRSLGFTLLLLGLLSLGRAAYLWDRRSLGAP